MERFFRAFGTLRDRLDAYTHGTLLPVVNGDVLKPAVRIPPSSLAPTRYEEDLEEYDMKNDEPLTLALLVDELTKSLGIDPTEIFFYAYNLSHLNNDDPRHGTFRNGVPSDILQLSAQNLERGECAYSDADHCHPLPFLAILVRRHHVYHIAKTEIKHLREMGSCARLNAEGDRVWKRYISALSSFIVTTSIITSIIEEKRVPLDSRETCASLCFVIPPETFIFPDIEYCAHLTSFPSLVP